MMFTPSRDEVRQFFCATWRNAKANQPLSDIEKMILAVILEHPEYQGILEQETRALMRDYTPEEGLTNPFLHMSMHLSLDEQISIDQPVGIKAVYTQMCERFGDAHKAQHEMMDCLAEMIWHAQRYATLPDPALYFACLSGKLQQEVMTRPLPD